MDLIDELIKLAFAEDIGEGDHTTLCCIPAEAEGAQKTGKIKRGSTYDGKYRI